MFNVTQAITPSPSIPLWPETVATPPRGEREAKPLPLDGGEVGERVVVAHHHIYSLSRFYEFN